MGTEIFDCYGQKQYAEMDHITHISLLRMSNNFGAGDVHLLWDGNLNMTNYQMDTLLPL